MYGCWGYVLLPIGKNETAFNWPSYICNAGAMCLVSDSLSNDKVTDTPLSDQYFWAVAAKPIFSKRLTSFSDLGCPDATGKYTTDVLADTTSSSILYPAALNK